MPLKVVFLSGNDSRSTRMSLEAVCKTAGVTPVGILVDTEQPSGARRFRNLRQNVRKHGWGYLKHRLLLAGRQWTDQLAYRTVLDPIEVEQLLRAAFPDRCFSVDDIGRKYGCPVYRVRNLNSAEAQSLLRQCGADLGVVVGTRILKAATFSIPPLGSINLHKGKVPEYRGMPPAFWEMYNGEKTAGVTVHFVDSKLDTGDIVETAEVSILPRDTPDTLLEKLHFAGADALARAVAAIESGNTRGRPQISTETKANRAPSIAHIAELRRRLPHWTADNPAAGIVKNIFYVGLYRSGLYKVLARRHRGSRAAIVLYHRVDDYSNDVLTVDTETFAAQLLAISKHHSTITTRELVNALRQGKPISPTAVLIHFDDAYRNVFTEGGPILKTAGVPAMWFVSSGFVNTDRQFEHDVEKYSFRYENCSDQELVKWVADGNEIGAHTVNHANLGTCPIDQAKIEVTQSGADLERILQQPVPFFSFPFGRIQNIRAEVRDLIMDRYEALFSAHGGFVAGNTDLSDIPRMGAHSGHSPLWLLMEIQALGVSDLRKMVPFSRR